MVTESLCNMQIVGFFQTKEARINHRERERERESEKEGFNVV